jgi:hypothetical protein
VDGKVLLLMHFEWRKDRGVMRLNVCGGKKEKVFSTIPSAIPPPS